MSLTKLQNVIQDVHQVQSAIVGFQLSQYIGKTLFLRCLNQSISTTSLLDTLRMEAAVNEAMPISSHTTIFDVSVAEWLRRMGRRTEVGSMTEQEKALARKVGTDIGGEEGGKVVDLLFSVGTTALSVLAAVKTAQKYWPKNGLCQAADEVVTEFLGQEKTTADSDEFLKQVGLCSKKVLLERYNALSSTSPDAILFDNRKADKIEEDINTILAALCDHQRALLEQRDNWTQVGEKLLEICESLDKPEKKE